MFWAAHFLIGVDIESTAMGEVSGGTVSFYFFFTAIIQVPHLPRVSTGVALSKSSRSLSQDYPP